MAWVYKIRNKLNCVVYIGSSKCFESRKEKHLYDLKQNKHGNIYLQRAWNKHGGSAFAFEVIEEVDNELQFDREQYYIDKMIGEDTPMYNLCVDVYNPGKRKATSKICSSCSIQFESIYFNQQFCPTCAVIRVESYLENVLKPKRRRQEEKINVFRRMRGEEEVEDLEENSSMELYDVLEIFGIEGFETGEARRCFDSDEEFEMTYKEAMEVWYD